jgi:hypothetical protein
MSEFNPGDNPTAESVCKAIMQLPRNERERLFRHMRKMHDWQLGYVVLSPSDQENSVTVKKIFKMLGLIFLKLGDLVPGLMEDAAIAYNRGKCARAKAEKTKQRHDLIDKLLAQGFSGADNGAAIYSHLQEHHPELLKLKRRREFISPQSMWKKYKASKKIQKSLE